MFILTMLMVSILYFISSNRKEFPVKVGQYWTFRKEVIPYINNIPQDKVMVEYGVKVIEVDNEGNIIYSRGIDTMKTNLETFLYFAELNKN